MNLFKTKEVRAELPPASMREAKLIANLKEKASMLPVYNLESESKAETMWRSRMIRLRELIATEDPRSLFEWDIIRNAVRVPDLFNTHAEYHLDTYLRNVGPLPQTITEFGGGTGIMLEAARAVGFKGTYTFVDFPEMLLVQEFCLASRGIDLSDVHFESDIHALKKTGLLMGLFSIAEAPVKTREELFARTQPDTTLIAYGPKFAEVDNATYFANLKLGKKIQHPPIPFVLNNKYYISEI